MQARWPDWAQGARQLTVSCCWLVVIALTGHGSWSLTRGFSTCELLGDPLSSLHHRGP